MDIVFLHGALGSSKQWSPFLSYFQNEARLWNLEFPGHGSAESTNNLKMNDLSDYLSDYLIKNQIIDPIIIGYSMGGYVAMDAILKNKIKCKKLITIATKMNWSVQIAEKEISKLNWEALAPLKDKLLEEHGDNLNNLLDLTKSIFNELGLENISSSDLKNFPIPLFMLIGENDVMVTVDETRMAAESAPDARLIILENQGHLLIKMDTNLLINTIKQLL